MKYKCDSCGHVCDEDDAVEALDLWDRLDEGSVYTTKECPECGMLTYPTEGYVANLEKQVKELEVRISHLLDV